MTETPPLTTANNYGKYSIPSLYLSLETTETSHLKIHVVYGFDALKNQDPLAVLQEGKPALKQTNNQTKLEGDSP